MLNRNDFILYMPMKGNLTDYSNNGYTATNNGATLTTGRDGVTDTAYSFDGSTEYITLTSAVNQAISTALGSSASIFYEFVADTNKLCAVLSAYYNTAENSFNLQLAADNSTFFALFNGGTGQNDNSLSYTNSQWVFYCHNMSSATAYTGYQDIDTTATKTFSISIKTNSTGLVNIGRRGDGGTNYFDGKIANIGVLDRPLTKLEQKYIKKFSNRKRVA